METEPRDPSALLVPSVVVVAVESTEKGGGKAEVGSPPATLDEGSFLAIDVACGGEEEEEEVEAACRICHLTSEWKEQLGSELIQLGCNCKGELGIAHRQCAETWFKVKGSRYCEICGANATNITGAEDARFMEEWYEGRELDNANSSGSSCWRQQRFCNFVLTCLVIAFISPWFLRVDIF